MSSVQATVVICGIKFASSWARHRLPLLPKVYTRDPTSSREAAYASPLIRGLNSSLIKETFWAIIFGFALVLPSFGQLALSTSTVTPTSVTVTWNKSPDRDVKGYRLHCGLTSGRDYLRFADVGNVTTHAFSDLIPGNTYYCVVTAYNAAGKEGLRSNEISFRVSPSTAPAITSSSVTLRWDKSPGRGVKGYRLHYGTTESSELQMIPLRILLQGPVLSSDGCLCVSNARYFALVDHVDSVL